MNNSSLAQKLNQIKTLAVTLGLAAAVERVLPGANPADISRQLAALDKPRKASPRRIARRTSKVTQARAQARALAELVARVNEPAEEVVGLW